MKFFGGSSFLDSFINPAGWLHSQQYKNEQKAAQQATEAAQAQAAAMEAEAKAQQQSLTLQAEQAALSASQGDTNTTQTTTSANNMGLADLRRKRGADAGTSITIGL